MCRSLSASTGRAISTTATSTRCWACAQRWPAPRPHLRDLLAHDPPGGRSGRRPLLRLHRRPGQQLRRRAGAGGRTGCRHRRRARHDVCRPPDGPPPRPRLRCGSASPAAVAAALGYRTSTSAAAHAGHLKASRDALAGAVQQRSRWPRAASSPSTWLVTALSLPGRGDPDAGRRRDVRPGWARWWCPSPPASARCWPSWWRATCCATRCRRASASALAPINAGIERDGAFYLLTLRLVPVFPFLAHQPADGPDADRRRHLLLGQPARHAGRHRWCT
jgi:hypothetical protein